MKVTIWHNKQCSTSRKILEFLENRGNSVEIRNYLTDTPTIEELKEVLKKMNLKPLDIIRKKELIYLENYNDKKLSPAQWLKILVNHPELIERPIIIKGMKAWLARPADEFMKNWE